MYIFFFSNSVSNGYDNKFSYCDYFLALNFRTFDDRINNVQWNWGGLLGHFKVLINVTIFVKKWIKKSQNFDIESL